MEKTNTQRINIILKNIEMKSWHDIKHLTCLNIHWSYVDVVTAAVDVEVFDTHTDGTIAINFVCVYDKNSLAV